MKSFVSVIVAGMILFAVPAFAETGAVPTPTWKS